MLEHYSMATSDNRVFPLASLPSLSQMCLGIEGLYVVAFSVIYHLGFS